jgi:hypothetical protein
VFSSNPGQEAIILSQPGDSDVSPPKKTALEQEKDMSDDFPPDWRQHWMVDLENNIVMHMHGWSFIFHQSGTEPETYDMVPTTQPTSAMLAGHGRQYAERLQREAYRIFMETLNAQRAAQDPAWRQKWTVDLSVSRATHVDGWCFAFQPAEEVGPGILRVECVARPHPMTYQHRLDGKRIADEAPKVYVEVQEMARAKHERYLH